MKRLSYLLTAAWIVLFTVQAKAIPAIVHAGVSPTNDSVGTITQYIMRLPQPMLNNNAGVAFLNGPTGVSPTNCTDDKSVAWTVSTNSDNTVQRISTYYTLGRTDGPQVLTCTWAAASTFISGALFEVTGIATSAALDQTCADHFSFTEIDCSTTATAVNGELVIAFATQTDTSATLTGWTPGAGYTQSVWDGLDSSYVVYQIQGTAGVAQPLVNMDTSRAGVIVALTFKPAASGTALSGMMPVNTYYFRHKAADTAPVWNFPCRGDENSIIIVWNGAAGRTISAISSTGTTGTWLEAGTGSVSGGSGKNQIWYLQNATCTAAVTVTPTLSGGSEPDSSGIIMSWIGGATTLLDSATPTSTTGNDTTGNPFTGASITPNAAGWTVAYIGAATGAGSQVVGSPGYFIAPQTVPVIDTNPVGENQGPVIKTNAGSVAYTVTWTPNSIAIGTYADYLVAFDQAGGGGGGNAGSRSLLGVGK